MKRYSKGTIHTLRNAYLRKTSLSMPWSKKEEGLVNFNLSDEKVDSLKNIAKYAVPAVVGTGLGAMMGAKYPDKVNSMLAKLQGLAPKSNAYNVSRPDPRSAYYAQQYYRNAPLIRQY